VVTTKNGMGIARIAIISLAALLLTGLIGSLVMGYRARGAALEDIREQATAITDASLGLVLKPDDLSSVASDSRASTLSDQIRRVVIEPSGFDTVTLWSSTADILYSTEEGRIGNRLAGEGERIRSTLREGPQLSTNGGTVSAMVPMRFESGVGDPAVVELTTSSGSVDSAGAPWRMMAWFSGIALLFVAGLLLWDRRHPLDAPSEQGTGGVAGSVVAAAMRPVTVPSPGVKEEGDARRKAEHRARAAEERLAVLQDQYRKTLDELQEAQNRLREATTSAADPSAEERAMQAEQRAAMLEEHARSADERARALEERSRELEDRARIFEREANSSRAELEEMTRLLSEARASADDASDLSLDAAGQEIIGLRAELEGAQTQLSSVRRELETVRARADRATQLEAELETLRAEVRKAREASTSVAPGASISPRELEDLRSEVRALRAEEQRAAMLQDELRSVKAELESMAASHRAELIEREVELEEKVRAAREEFQGELARAQARHAEELAAREEQANARLANVEDGAQKQVDAVQRELGERTKRFANAEDEIAKAQAEAARLGSELTVARAELETTVAQLASRTDELAGMKERLQELERTSSEAVARSERLAAELEEAAKDNIDVNRRLQELESRRQLELADAEGRADLDEILRVTQERLAGQTEKLIAAEERVHTLEREAQIAAAKLEETESELRQQQMAAAMRHIRGDDGAEADQQPAAVPLPDGAPLEDRRATSPFMQELSTDARKSLTRIMGITQILKHKPDAKDQTQLVRQLTTHTRRLEHIVADLADADRLVRGEVELNVRRTDLEPLVRRVVEESGIDADHEVRIETERVVVAVDQVRTEQILSGLLRASGDRTPAKKTIAVRLTTADGGALIAVEDPEPSSDASLGPMVTRFAELQGGWAKVESRENGGSSFKVFLPDGAKPQPPADTSSPSEEAATDDALHIVVDGTASSPVPESSASIDGNALVQELHRLSTAED
jgi:DNA repair exonuclease SbcCD ATPase subunit